MCAGIPVEKVEVPRTCEMMQDISVNTSSFLCWIFFKPGPNSLKDFGFGNVYKEVREVFNR